MWPRSTRYPTRSTPRALFIGNIGDQSVALGFVVMVVLALLAMWWAARSFRQAAA